MNISIYIYIYISWLLLYRMIFVAMYSAQTAVKTCLFPLLEVVHWWTTYMEEWYLVSEVEDATALIRDTRDNLISQVPLGLAPCLCHRLVCRSVSACFSRLGINCWDSLDSQDSPAVCWGGPWWRSAVCSTCFGSPASNFVLRTAILCRSLWQFMQHVDYTRGIFSRLFESRQLCFHGM